MVVSGGKTLRGAACRSPTRLSGMLRAAALLLTPSTTPAEAPNRGFPSGFQKQMPIGVHALLNKAPSSGNLVEALDGLRGFAVLIVIASHANVFGMKGQGAMGVWLFYILSGFLLTKILLQKLPESLSPSGLAKYLIRRVARILPLYYSTLTLVMFIEGRGPLWLFQHFTFQRADGHFWSIPQEELFYVMLPVLVAVVILLKKPLPAIHPCKKTCN